MDLARPAAARAADGFFPLPLFEPAAERCPFMWLLSIDSSSGTGPAAAARTAAARSWHAGKSRLPLSDSEPIEAAAAIGYSAAAFAADAGILNRAFCSSRSVA